MKGGKAGRTRKGAAGGAARQGGARGKPKKAGAHRPESTAPKKGSRKKTFGAVPSARDE